jgi:hypothetical protein
MEDELDKCLEKINTISTMTNVKEIMNYIELLLTQRINFKVDQMLFSRLCDLLDFEYKNFTSTANSKLYLILKSLNIFYDDGMNSKNLSDSQKIYSIFINICMYIYSYCYMIDKYSNYLFIDLIDLHIKFLWDHSEIINYKENIKRINFKRQLFCILISVFINVSKEHIDVFIDKIFNLLVSRTYVLSSCMNDYCLSLGIDLIQYISTFEWFNSHNFYFDYVNRLVNIASSHEDGIIIAEINSFKIKNTHRFSNILSKKIDEYEKSINRSIPSLIILYEVCKEILYMPIGKNLRFCWISSVIRIL